MFLVIKFVSWDLYAEINFPYLGEKFPKNWWNLKSFQYQLNRTKKIIFNSSSL